MASTGESGLRTLRRIQVRCGSSLGMSNSSLRVPERWISFALARGWEINHCSAWRRRAWMGSWPEILTSRFHGSGLVVGSIYYSDARNVLA